MVSLQMAGGSLIEGAQKRLPHRGAATGATRAPGASASLLYDHRLARPISDHARERVPGDALRYGVP